MMVNSKSVLEIQQMLYDCQHHLHLEVMRCRRVTPTSSDMSQSSSFPTPSSPLTADEFDPSSMTDVSIRRENHSALPHADDPVVLHKPERLQTRHLNAAEPSMGSSRDSGSHIGRNKENKPPNFLDKAVNAIRRPFLRSRQSRSNQDAHSKSAFMYVGNSSTAVDDVVSGSGLNISAATGSRWPDSDAYKEQTRSLPRMKLSDSGHGTWPKYHVHATQRPPVAPMYTVQPSSSTDDDSPYLPKPAHHGIEIRRSESARHHRQQNSDSVVDYVRQVDVSCSRQKISSATEDVPKSLAAYNKSFTDDSVTPLGPHYAKRFPDPTSETTVTVRSRLPAEHHVTVISHFPVEPHESEMVSRGGLTKYTQRPIPHTGHSFPENHLLHSSGVIMSSPPTRPQFSLGRFVSFYI